MMVDVALLPQHSRDQRFRLRRLPLTGKKTRQRGPGPVDGRSRRGASEGVQHCNATDGISIVEIRLGEIGVGIRSAAALAGQLEVLDRVGVAALEKVHHTSGAELLYSVRRIHHRRLPVLSLRQIKESEMIERGLTIVVRYL